MALVAFLWRVQRARWLPASRLCAHLTCKESTIARGQSKTQEEEPQIPMVPKRRDPHAVLKALESTLEPVEYEIYRGMGPANPMYPYSKLLRMEYVKHLEAGRKAAKYVLYRWPAITMYKKLDSDPVVFEKKPLERNILKKRRHQAWWIYKKMKENGEEIPLETRNSLLALLAHFGLGNAWATERDAKRILKSYRDLSWWPVGEAAATQAGEARNGSGQGMEGSGEVVALGERTQISASGEGIEMSASEDEMEISEETKKDLGVAREVEEEVMASGEGGAQEAGSEESVSEEDKMVGSEEEREGEDAGSDGTDQVEAASEKKQEFVVDEATGVRLSKTKIKDGVKIWRMDSAAEQIFNDIADKNGESYEALIEGLVKHKYHKRAFQLFDEMRDKGYQAHTQTYNLLLTSLLDISRVPKTWTKAMFLLKQMRMEPVAWPNADTFNLLLQIASSNPSAIELAGCVMREMFYIGVEPTLTTFYWLMQPYFDKGGPFVLNEIVKYLEENPQVLKIQDTCCHLFFREAMMGCRQVKDHSLAMRLKKVAESAGNSGLVDNPVQFLNTYMAILCGGSGTIDHLKAEYRRLVPKRELRHEWVFGFMFKAAWEAGDPDFALEVFEDMGKYDVDLRRVETIVHLSIALKKASSPEKAESYLKALEKGMAKLEANSVSPHSSILISNLMKLSLACGNLDKIWHYFEMFKTAKLDPSFEGLAVLLKALYQISSKEELKDADRATVEWIFREMVRLNKYMPPRYVRNLCQSFGIDQKLSDEFVEKLTQPTTTIRTHYEQ